MRVNVTKETVLPGHPVVRKDFSCMAHDSVELISIKFQAARACLADDELLRAKAIYQEILAIDPMHGDALQMLGIVDTELGLLDSAVDLLCKAIEINPDSDNAYYHLGFAMCKLEQFAAGLIGQNPPEYTSTALFT